MKKILFILLIILSVFTFGCTKKENKNKIYLDDEFYGNSEFIGIKKDKVEELKEEESTYVLYTYNNFCTMEIPCEEIFKSFMEKYNISFYSIPFKEFKETYLNNTVKYAPTIIIVKNGKIIDYLDVNKDSDYDKYQDLSEFTKWIENIIYLNNL